jgi:hypothetical protein
MLNGKAKEEFEKWFFNYYNKDKVSVAMVNHDVIFKSLQEIVQQSYIIEWFDSIGYFLDRDMAERNYKLWTKDNWEKEPIIIDCMYCEKLSEWLPKAIEKVSEIFNQLNK